MSTIFQMGTQLPSPKGYSLPQFSAHGCCGQMTGWIKMPLGREAGLGQGDIVLDGDPASPHHGHMLLDGNPPKKGAQPPIFGPCLLWPNGRPCQLLLSTCCTAHPIAQLPIVYALQWVFSWPDTLKVPIFMRPSAFPCNTCSPYPPDSAFQTASRSVQPFLHSSRQGSPYSLQCALKCN